MTGGAGAGGVGGAVSAGLLLGVFSEHAGQAFTHFEVNLDAVAHDTRQGLADQ